MHEEDLPFYPFEGNTLLAHIVERLFEGLPPGEAPKFIHNLTEAMNFQDDYTGVGEALALWLIEQADPHTYSGIAEKFLTLVAAAPVTEPVG